jgi:Leucine-rich repeat (LRR) protein
MHVSWVKEDGLMTSCFLQALISFVAIRCFRSLNGNHFTGSIPSNFGNLTKLIELDLSDNHLTGPIPPDLGNLSRLMLLNLYGNQLNGKIPISSDNSSWGINNLTELVTL